MISSNRGPSEFNAHHHAHRHYHVLYIYLLPRWWKKNAVRAKHHRRTIQFNYRCCGLREREKKRNGRRKNFSQIMWRMGYYFIWMVSKQGKLNIRWKIETLSSNNLNIHNNNDDSRWSSNRRFICKRRITRDDRDSNICFTIIIYIFIYIYSINNK